jgi:hypothetical protein
VTFQRAVDEIERVMEPRTAVPGRGRRAVMVPPFRNGLDGNSLAARSGTTRTGQWFRSGTVRAN